MFYRHAHATVLCWMQRKIIKVNTNTLVEEENARWQTTVNLHPCYNLKQQNEKDGFH